MGHPFNLERFIDAQTPVYDEVHAELLAGHKRTHWMWFIFPQMAGLGHSDTARHFAIAHIEEAQAYLSHPVLGERLTDCCKLVAAHKERSASDIFGHPDDLKFHSSLTLFSEAAPDPALFDHCLQLFFDGKKDQATLDLL